MAMHDYMEVPRPAGDGLCSDDACPCGYPGATIQRGEGYLYISQQVVDFRRDCPSVFAAERKVRQDFGGGMIMFANGVIAPILVCAQGARKRGLDLEVAAADARHWWKTGQAPLRATPLAGAAVSRAPAREVPKPTAPPPERKPAPMDAATSAGLDAWIAKTVDGVHKPETAEDGELFRFHCTRCGKRLKAYPKQVGKKVKCPKCGESQKVPAPGADAPHTRPGASPAPKPAATAPTAPVPPPDSPAQPAATSDGGSTGAAAPAAPVFRGNRAQLRKVQDILQATRASLDAAIVKRGGKLDANGLWTPPNVVELTLAQFGEVGKSIWQQEFPAGADLKGDTRLDLRGADLQGSFFCASGYQGFPLRNADLREACLDRTNWSFMSVNDSDFTGARLRRCHMMSVFADGTSFRKVDFSGAFVNISSGRDSRPTDFSGAKFDGATIRLLFGPVQFVMKGADLRGCAVVSGSNQKTAADNRAYYKEVLDSFLACLSKKQRDEIKLTILEPPRDCFIATAACGTDQAEDVVRLRAFRDAVLRGSRTGRAFIRCYEAVSPPVARLLARSAVARALVRRLIVHPAARLAGAVMAEPRS